MDNTGIGLFFQKLHLVAPKYKHKEKNIVI